MMRLCEGKGCMRMNITILEDRPETMKTLVATIKEMGSCIQNIVCYTSDKENADGFQEYAKSVCKEMGVNCILVDNITFDRVLDELYKDKEMQFWFDMDLVGDFSNHFLQRINVSYARKKKEKEKDDGRIWFYTTGPLSAIEQIDEYFPNRRIPVRHFSAINGISFDYEFIRENVLGQE